MPPAHYDVDVGDKHEIGLFDHFLDVKITLEKWFETFRIGHHIYPVPVSDFFREDDERSFGDQFSKPDANVGVFVSNICGGAA